MADTAPTGFVARNNQVIGSSLSIAAFVVSVALGAGLMFGTGTRGVSAILTVLTIAGGSFTLLLVAIGASLEALTPSSQWEREENEWRAGMGLPARTADDITNSQKSRSRAVAFGVLAIVVGLALSVVPAAL